MDSSDLHPHVTHASLGTQVSASIGVSVGSAVFAYTTAKTPDVYQQANNPQNSPFPLGIRAPHRLHGSSVSPQMAS